MSEESLASIAQTGAVAEVAIDNPPANALTNELYARLQTLTSELDRDDTVRAVVFVSAHPTIFVSGADIGAMARYDFSREAIERKVTLVHQTFLGIQRLSKPTLASIEGHALGGGCELALSLDMRFMSRGKARIGLPEAGLGIVPGGGGTQRLPRLVGRARAAQMMMLGERLGADDAERCGLVNAACDDAAATRAAAHEMARRLSEMPRSSLRLIKRCLNDGYDHDLVRGLEVERTAAIEALLQPEAREGIAAFLERRPARFHGAEPAA
ncbi:MAG TPA: enoyl-CoA hydratase/isomerase family protein [Solirubrobacteraceae bacterium]|nr:enoyl-CoA hydratase/isomerase family protein [Solirubrobacteraceae bacterium]